MAVDAHRRFARPTWYHFVLGAQTVSINDCLSAFAIVLLDILSLPIGGNSFVIVGLVAIDAWAYGAVPHLKPQSQNDLIELALGPTESSRFYSCVLALHELSLIHISEPTRPY